MSDERGIRFKDAGWLAIHREALNQRIRQLPTFVESSSDQLWLLGHEDRQRPDRWAFDVRFISHLEGTALLIEVSAHPPSIDADLATFMAWLEAQTEIEHFEI